MQVSVRPSLEPTGLLKGIRLNPDVYAYMKDMPETRRRHLRGAARKVDEAHVFSNFREEYTKASDADAAQKRAATDQKKEKADKRLTELQEFKPVLNLDGKTIGQDRVDRMKNQLRWHRVIGGDEDIPSGFYNFNKQKLWDTMVQAIERHESGNPGHDGKCPTSSLPF